MMFYRFTDENGALEKRRNSPGLIHYHITGNSNNNNNKMAWR